MIHDKDIELIEKYLSDNLTREERKIFDEKNETDNEFSEEVLFRKNLNVAAERIVTAEFKSMLNNIHNNSVNKGHKKVYISTTVALSAAALLLLFFFVVNPLANQFRVKKYVAEAGKTETLSIQNISAINLKSNENINNNSFGKLKVAFIVVGQNHKNLSRYFFNENVLYIFKQSADVINLFYEIDVEGERVYYLCRNKQLFSFKQLEDNKLYILNPVTGSGLENRCY